LEPEGTTYLYYGLSLSEYDPKQLTML